MIEYNNIWLCYENKIFPCDILRCQWQVVLVRIWLVLPGESGNQLQISCVYFSDWRCYRLYKQRTNFSSEWKSFHDERFLCQYFWSLVVHDSRTVLLLSTSRVIRWTRLVRYRSIKVCSHAHPTGLLSDHKCERMQRTCLKYFHSRNNDKILVLWR